MKTWHGYLGLMLALGLALLWSCAANAQDCAPFRDIAAFLAQKYDEHPVKVGQVPSMPAFVVLFESAHGTASFVTVGADGGLASRPR